MQPFRGIQSLINGTTIATVILAFGLFLLRILTHVPFYDELLHMRFLYLISDGLTPHVDFWCSYPIAGYLLTLPLFKICPENMYTLLVLRGIMMAEFAVLAMLLAHHSKKITGSPCWGLAPFLCVMAIAPLARFSAEFSIDPLAMLAAAGALSLFFVSPNPKRLFTAAFLSLLSIAITPKYPAPLFFGLLGYCLSYLVQQRRLLPLVKAIFLAIAAAVSLLTLLYFINGCSLISNINGTHVMMSRYNFYTSQLKENSVQLLAQVILAYAPRFPFAAGFILLGITGWLLALYRQHIDKRQDAASTSRRSAVPALAPAGCLLGLLLFSLRIHNRLEQYILPTFLTLVFFAPYMYHLFRRCSPQLQQTILLIFFVATLTFQLSNIRPLCDEFKETPLTSRDAKAPGVRFGPSCLTMLSYMQQLLEITPSEERVAAHWEAHPVYRRDLTFITADDNPSFLNVLPEKSSDRVAFEPHAFRSALNETFPAIIAPSQFSANYPPGWTDVAIEFINTHPESYTRYPSPIDPYVFVRNDLLPTQ